MDNLWIKINGDIKKAMMDKDAKKLATLRMILADLKNKMIDLKERDNIADDKVIEILKTAVKKRKDSIELYLQGKRQDLADQEKSEIEIIEEYLPEQMGEEEIEKIVREVADSSPDKNFGKIMGQVMGRTKGKVDGNKVSEIVKKVLRV